MGVLNVTAPKSTEKWNKFVQSLIEKAGLPETARVRLVFTTSENQPCIIENFKDLKSIAEKYANIKNNCYEIEITLEVLGYTLKEYQTRYKEEFAVFKEKTLHNNHKTPFKLSALRTTKAVIKHLISNNVLLHNKNFCNQNNNNDIYKNAESVNNVPSVHTKSPEKNLIQEDLLNLASVTNGINNNEIASLFADIVNAPNEEEKVEERKTNNNQENQKETPSALQTFDISENIQNVPSNNNENMDCNLFSDKSESDSSSSSSESSQNIEDAQINNANENNKQKKQPRNKKKDKKKLKKLKKKLKKLERERKLKKYYKMLKQQSKLLAAKDNNEHQHEEEKHKRKNYKKWRVDSDENENENDNTPSVLATDDHNTNTINESIEKLNSCIENFSNIVNNFNQCATSMQRSIAQFSQISNSLFYLQNNLNQTNIVPSTSNFASWKQSEDLSIQRPMHTSNNDNNESFPSIDNFVTNQFPAVISKIAQQEKLLRLQQNWIAQMCNNYKNKINPTNNQLPNSAPDVWGLGVRPTDNNGFILPEINAVSNNDNDIISNQMQQRPSQIQNSPVLHSMSPASDTKNTKNTKKQLTDLLKKPSSPEIEDKLNKLKEMGYDNRTFNLVLLEQNKGDMDKVITDLKQFYEH